MKTCVSYNVWDAWELLTESISRIRSHADYINVVLQNKSNYGNDLYDIESRKNTIEILVRDKMIDKVLHYIPVSGYNAMHNEVYKRIKGMEDAKENCCTHISSMDCDEMYNPEQFAWMLSDIKKNNRDFTACQLQTYYKQPDIRFKVPESYHVTLFHRIDNNNLHFAKPIPDNFKRNIKADPTRVFPVHYHTYQRSEIEMHHLSHVRENYRQKLENSSAKVNFPAGSIDKVCKYFDKYKYPMPAMVVGAEITMQQVEKAPKY